MIPKVQNTAVGKLSCSVNCRPFQSSYCFVITIEDGALISGSKERVHFLWFWEWIYLGSSVENGGLWIKLSKQDWIYIYIFTCKSRARRTYPADRGQLSFVSRLLPSSSQDVFWILIRSWIVHVTRIVPPFSGRIKSKMQWLITWIDN